MRTRLAPLVVTAVCERLVQFIDIVKLDAELLELVKIEQEPPLKMKFSE